MDIKCDIKTSNLAWFYNQKVLELWGEKYYLRATLSNGDRMFCKEDDNGQDIIVQKPRNHKK